MNHKLWINGAWHDSQGGQTLMVENPATGEKIATVGGIHHRGRRRRPKLRNRPERSLRTGDYDQCI